MNSFIGQLKSVLLLTTLSLLILIRVLSTGERESSDPDFYSYPLKGAKGKYVHPQKCIYSVFGDLNC